MVKLTGTITISNGTKIDLSFYDGGTSAQIGYSGGSVWVIARTANTVNRPIIVTAEYTKTTDTA